MVFRPVQTRVMIRELTRAGWTRARTNGSHTVWNCRSGRHHFTLPDGHREISGGVAQKARAALAGDECEEQT
jgi:predicted RNA binding protein YcfA (HicA-like mRNA interferase family)